MVDPEDPQALATTHAWLAAHPIRALNVAGPSEATCPGIGERAFSLLVGVLAPP